MEGKEILALGIIKRVGTGEDTDIWSDNWIPRDYKLRPLCALRADPPRQVAELIDPVTRTWNKQFLVEHFVGPDVDAILNIPLSSRLQDDFYAWHYDKRCIFSVKSAYRMLTGIKYQREDWIDHGASTSYQASTKRDWTRLWKTRVPSKVRVFTWCLAHTSLPTGVTRHHRKMVDTVACTLCNAQEDTWCHSLFDCRMARCVWALGEEEILEHVISNRSEDPRLWLFWLFDTLNEQELAKVLITMWAIWWARRRAIHDDEYQSPLSTMCFISRYFEDLDIATARRVTLNEKTPQRRVHRWIPPGEDAVKINVDGAISRSGMAGAAASICRYKHGN